MKKPKNGKISLSELRQYKEEIIKLYVEEKNMMPKLAKLYNCNITAISRLFKENNVELVPHTERTRKHKINQNFFEDIDTPEKAYVLGFFYADGCNYEKGRYISITVARKDEEILSKIINVMGADVKIKQGKNKSFSDKTVLISSIQINSKKLSEDLAKQGCPSNKTFKINFPSWLPDNLIPHFIRGYYDGDGCISKDGKNRVVCNFISNEYFIKQIGNFLVEKNFNCIIKPDYDHPKNWLVWFFKQEEIKKFLDYIYKDSTIHLQRKYDRYYSHFYEGKPIIPYSQQQSQDEILNNIDNKNPNPETGEINLKDD